MTKLLLIVGFIAAAGFCWLVLDQTALGAILLIPAGYFYYVESRRQSPERVATISSVTTDRA